MDEDMVQFIGLKDLEQVEQDMVNTISAEYFEKIKRGLKNLVKLVVHIKKVNKGGKQSHFWVKVRAEAPTAIIESEQDDWDLARVLHKVYKNIERQIDHKFKDLSAKIEPE